MTLESRLKMSKVRKGRKQSPEHIKNLQEARKGKPRPQIAGVNNPMFGKARPPHVIEAIKKAQKGRKHPPRTEEHRERLRQSQLGPLGSNWKGGLTPIHKLVRSSAKYKEWRRKVFERDDWTCQGCGEIGGILNADHIQPFAYFPELRFELDNGRTLCLKCHKETSTYAVHR